uniref:Serpin domain-containing protein n=1 Tax=Setaria digitata TaxID=48799 RepID=A0A915PQZ3_9BILA
MLTLLKNRENLRITSEEWNIAISPLQIVRGFAALHILADGKCKTKLASLISKALFGVKAGIDKSIHEELDDICTNYLKSLPLGTVRVYFEENHLLTFDDELVEYIEKYYGKEFRRAEPITVGIDEVTRKKVVQTMCFQMNPDGQTLISEMNKNIKEATHENMEYVVRRDLPPRRETRLTLVTSFNSVFHWKPTGQVVEVETFFYETCKKVTHMRSVIKAYQCNGLFRTCLTNDGIRVLELDSETDHLKM